MSKNIGDKQKTKSRASCKEPYGDTLVLPLDTPEDWNDYDDMRWYLAHKRVSIYVWQGKWYLQIRNKCRYLAKKKRKCKIQTERPAFCTGRSHVPDRSTMLDKSDMYFRDDKQMKEWMRIRFPRRAKREFCYRST